MVIVCDNDLYSKRGLHQFHIIFDVPIFLNIKLTANQRQYSHYLNNIDIYVLPVANPDGYEYTWTTDRSWRKTRSGPINGCYGVDPNRNFDYKYGGIDNRIMLRMCDIILCVCAFSVRNE